MKAGERFRILRKHFGYIQKEMADILEVTQRSVQNYEKSEYLRPEVIKKLVNEFKVNELWLLTGLGEMFSKEGDTTVTDIESADEQPDVISIPIFDNEQVSDVIVKEYDLDEDCGSLRVEKSAIPYASRKMRMLKVKDNDMVPAVKKDDLVIFKVSPFKKNGPYVIEKDGNFIVRRIKKENDEYILTADSDDELTLTIKEDDEDIKIVGRIIHKIVKFR